MYQIIRTELKESEEEEISDEEEEEIDLDELLSEIDSKIMLAQTIAQNQLMKAMTLTVNVDSYYAKRLRVVFIKKQ